jgi:hypothetical protein
MIISKIMEMEENKMNKIYQRSLFLVMVALLITTLVVGCGAPAAEAPPAEEVEEPPPAEGEGETASL